MAPPAPAEEDDDLDEVLGIEHRPRWPSRRRARRETRSGAGAEEPVKPWRKSAEPDEGWDDAVDDRRRKGASEKPPIFWRARDSLYFEPLVALAILAILLVSLFAYTSNWPPVYVVESNSMQHGNGDHLGVLNAGDIVLAEKVPVSSIVTYVQATQTGFATYGSFGDVLLYYPNGTTTATPIVHRAIIYLQFDPNGSYNATGLTRSKCGQGNSYEYYVQGPSNGCVTTDLKQGDTLTLYDVRGAWDRNVTLDFLEAWTNLGSHSGFLTLGDNNTYPDQLPPGGDPLVLSSLVEPGWVIGVARGMIPWFGAVKLLLDGNSAKVPAASWEFLGLTIAGVIFAAAGAHFLLRRREELPRRSRALEQEELDEEREERGRTTPGPAPARTRGAVRPWKEADDEKAEPGAAPPRRLSYEQRRRAHFVTSRERRPKHARKKDGKGSEDSDRSEPAS